MCSKRASLRGSGGTLSARLASVRAVILRDGKPSWIVYCEKPRPVHFHLSRAKDIAFAFDRLRRLGASVASVAEFRSLSGVRLSVSTPVDWLLLSNPVLISTSVASQKS